jgi:hypothetical protein
LGFPRLQVAIGIAIERDDDVVGHFHCSDLCASLCASLTMSLLSDPLPRAAAPTLGGRFMTTKPAPV